MCQPHVNPVHFVHVPCVYCILSCAMCVAVFCALFVFTEQVLQEVVRFEDSQFFSFPPLVRPLCGTIIMQQKKAFVKLIYHFGNVTKSFSSDLMLSSNVFRRENENLVGSFMREIINENLPFPCVY